MKKRANGEGTIYNTIQKNKRSKFLEKMCNTCKDCTEKCNREQFEKCDKCINCKDCMKYCDRYYCYKVTKAQVTVNNQRKSAGTGKNSKEVNEKKSVKEKELNIKSLIKNGELTLSETMRQNEKNKLEYKLINENSYNRNINTIKLIENYPISYKKIYEIEEDDLKELFAILVDINTSQSNLEKVYDEIHQVIMLCKKGDLFDNIKRSTFVSNINKKKVTAFTIEEQRKIIEYINTHENLLVNKNKCDIDCTTVKNLIKFAFATAMRIGEICSLDKNNDIDFENKKIIINKTLTKNISGKTIVGTSTKTGRKNKRRGENDVRLIQFDILFDESEVEFIINEQKQNSISNLLFSTKDGKIIEHSSINSIFKRICKCAGITKECNIHMTKHTGVTRMKENNIDIYVISKLVGTSVKVLTQTYAHIFDDFVEKEIEKSKIVRQENNLKLSYNNEDSNCKIIPFKKYV